MADKVYLGRGLHNSALKDSFTKGKLKGFIDVVKKDKDLVFQIRNDYANIYYKGGNLAKIESENSIQFDENYFNRETDKEKREIAQKTICRNKKNKWLIELKSRRNYKAYVEQMKPLMEKYWNWLNKELKEKDMQHSLCINNTEKDIYTVIDLEFQISTISDYCYIKPPKPYGRDRDSKKKSPRFDIVAVRNSDKQLCVIELKCGTGALDGKSGLGDHADSFEGTIKRNPAPFVTEIKKIIQDKKDLDLLNKDFSINEKAPEFLFAFVASNKKTEKQEWDEMLKQMQGQNCTMYKVMKLENDGNYRLGNECRV